MKPEQDLTDCQEELSEKQESITKPEQDLTDCQEELSEIEKIYRNALKAEMLGKTKEQLRDDCRNAEQLIKKYETKILHMTNKHYMEKQNLEDELQKRKSAMFVLLEKVDVLTSQLLSESSLDERAITLVQFLNSVKRSFFADVEGNQSFASSLDHVSTAIEDEVSEDFMAQPTPPEPEILEGSVAQDETNIAAPPLHKRAKVSELYEISETEDIPE